MPKTPKELSAARKAAWETRRAKYGPHGHKGSYHCGYVRYADKDLVALVDRMRRHLARLHNDVILSEGQFCKMAELGRIDARILADEVRDEE